MTQLFQFREGHLTESNQSLSRGMLYGDGFFESMRYHEGIILLRHLHEDRIRKSAALLQMSLQDFPGLATIEATLRESNPQPHLRIRLIIQRSGTGFYLPEENTADIFVQVQPLDSFYTLNESGYHCIRYTDQQKATGKYSVIKSTSALLYVMASLKIKAMHADEAIIYNSSGNIAEGSSTNLFIVKDKAIITPALDEGCVDGVFRRHLIITAGYHAYTLHEKKVTDEDLLTADELWFTSSIRGLHWAKSCGDKTYGNQEAKKVQRLLAESLL